MHTGLLCIEALQTIEQVEAGNIKFPNVLHVTSELCANFEKDPVAQSLVPLPLSAFVPVLKNPKSGLKELTDTLELLAVQLSPAKYRARNEELLTEELLGRQSTQEVRRLTRSYATSLIAEGFSQRYLNETTLQFFYFGQNRIGGPDAIRDFFALFPMERSEYTVVFRVEKIFDHVTNSFSPLNLSITNTLPTDINLSAFPGFSSARKQCLYAIASKVPARDVYSARSKAENLLKLCATLLSIFHHREDPTWLAECIVLGPEKKTKLVSGPLNSMHKCADLLQSVASKRLQLFMSDFSLERDSFAKFIRSAQLHSMALRSNAHENQILNLWIALESLVPSETKSEDMSNIEHIVASVVPFLNSGYLERLLNTLVKDLLRWNHKCVRAALRTVPGKKFIDKIAKLLVLPQFDHERLALEAAFRDFHLLRDRFAYFRSILASPANLLAALDAHRIRLEWQLRRIYRTRNIIVHSGNTPNYTSPLIEHTHDYLDTVLSALIELASKPKAIHSVGQGFKYMQLKYDNHLSRLKEKNLCFTIDNMDSLLFSR